MSVRALLDAAAILKTAADVLERAALHKAHCGIKYNHRTNDSTHHTSENLEKVTVVHEVDYEKNLPENLVSNENQSDQQKTTVNYSTSLKHDSTFEISTEIPLDKDTKVATPASFQRPISTSRVPSSRIARLMQYGGLAASVTAGAATAYATGGKSNMFSGPNVNRIVKTLSRMRGAALKLGQFLSIQNAELLPKEIEQILQQVQNGADIMPQWQCENVLEVGLGKDWRLKFQDWNWEPMASASIGQVHDAKIYRENGSEVNLAVKVQFPGVREAIGSDINQLKWLLIASSILPKGLFLENTLKVMKRELEEECDYTRESAAYEAFGLLLKNDESFKVPEVFKSITSERVLSTEKMDGIPLGRANIRDWSQEKRDKIGYTMLRLCLRELFHFRLVQTDPNWTNFLWNDQTQKIELVDFGATRAYTKEFVEKYKSMLLAAANGDEKECIERSIEIGYIKPLGEENPRMVAAHARSMLALGSAFHKDNQPFNFYKETITARVRAEIPEMLAHRSSPPPQETYSLNRKLSGIFLMCARLGSRIPARELLDDVLSSTADHENVIESIDRSSFL